VSGEVNGEPVDVAAVAGREVGSSGIPSAEALVGLVEAAVARDAEALPAAREAVVEELGFAGLVDACAVLGNFERMTRIADGTGIPLDTSAQMISDDLRETLGLDDFSSAGNTQAMPAWARVMAPAIRKLARFVLPRVARRMGPGKG